MDVELWKPADILECFGCDTASQGFSDFVELVHRIRLKWRDIDGNRAVLGDIVGEMCRIRGISPQMFYCRLKRAVSPLLTTDESVLDAFGIHLKKRTSSALAYALAELYEQFS